MNFGLQGALETKFAKFGGDLGLGDGTEIAGYASLFGAPDQGGELAPVSTGHLSTAMEA
ncbi:hypothetical protein [Amaricoccus sp. W119]|uniref:hypothetical protein n=1 Tax=Amaricoccus sp. W119 TaxID=3391833 RepID=UPI0039A65922